MHDLIKSKKKIPLMVLDEHKGLVELRGSSIMENAKEFYEPMMEWAFAYVSHPKDTTVNIDLEYFNTSSAKILLIFIKTLSKIQQAGYDLKVNWYYEEDDEDIIESGHNFALSSKVKFHFIKKDPESLLSIL